MKASLLGSVLLAALATCAPLQTHENNNGMKMATPMSMIEGTEPESGKMMDTDMAMKREHDMDMKKMGNMDEMNTMKDMKDMKGMNTETAMKREESMTMDKMDKMTDMEKMKEMKNMSTMDKMNMDKDMSMKRGTDMDMKKMGADMDMRKMNKDMDMKEMDNMMKRGEERGMKGMEMGM